MNKIYVLTKRPGEPPRRVWISDTLENLQRFVGGYIEIVHIASDLVLICDEEGRLKNKPYNCTLLGAPFVGDIIICGTRGEELDSLPCDRKRLKQYFPQLWIRPERLEKGDRP